MVVMRHVGQVIRTPAPGPPWDRIVAWGSTWQQTTCPGTVVPYGWTPRAANLVSDSLVQNPPCHVWVVWLSGVLSMREIRNHGPGGFRCGSQTRTLGHPPTVPPLALRRPGGQHVPSGDSLLQWAGTRVPTALRSPNPPMDNGNDADAFIPASHWFKSTSRIRAQALQIWCSWLCTQCSTKSGSQPAKEKLACNRTMQQNEPSTLQIMDHRNSAEQQIVFGGHLLQELPDINRMTKNLLTLAGGMAPRTVSKRSMTDQWLWLSSQARRRLVVGCLPDSIFWSCPHEFESCPDSTTRFPGSGKNLQCSPVG